MGKVGRDCELQDVSQPYVKDGGEGELASYLAGDCCPPQLSTIPSLIIVSICIYPYPLACAKKNGVGLQSLEGTSWVVWRAQKQMPKTKGNSIIFGGCWAYESGLRFGIRALEVPFSGA